MRLIGHCSPVVPANFSYFCTHPRHHPENGLRLLEEGDRVEGSSGFPGSVCLHPLHDAPPVCTASSLVLLSSPLLIQRHRAADTECALPTPTTTAAAAAAAGCASLPGSVSLSVVVFNFTSEFPLVLFRLTEHTKLQPRVLDDAPSSLSAGAGGGHVNARHEAHNTCEHAHGFTAGARLCSRDRVN